MPIESQTVDSDVLDATIRRIAPNLVQQDDGVWASRSLAEVSYPEEAHDLCFDIEAGSFWFRHRNDVILRAMRRFPPTGPVFDIGGGNGFVSAALRDAGFGTVLVEPGASGARNAARRGLRPIVRASVDDAGFVPSTLPAAGLFDVVEHVADDAAFLRTIRSLLEPGARLYVTVPAMTWLWSAEDQRAGHFRRYSLKAISDLLGEAGFTVEFSSYFFAFLVWPLFLRRSLPSRLGLRGPSGDDYVDEHAPPSPRVRRLLDRWSRAELDRLDRGARIARGTSCIVVCRLMP